MQRLCGSVLILLTALATLAGCRPGSPEGGDMRVTAPVEATMPGALIRSAKPYQAPPKAEQPRHGPPSYVRRLTPDADMKAVAAGNNEFACSLYRELASEEGNVAFSPLSVSVAMAMLYAGARGQSAEQLAGALHFSLPRERLHPAFNRLMSALEPVGQRADDQLRLDVLNALWLQKGGKYLDSFLDTLSVHYDTGVYELDFARDPGGALRAINAWVDKATGGRIRDLMDDGDISSETALAIGNAVYFRARWASEFKEADTVSEPFHRLDGTTVNVEMMHQTHHDCFAYAKGDGYQVVSLPYFGEGQAMAIVLPDEGGFEAAERALSGSALDSVLAKLQGTHLHVGLPRFAFRREADLAGALVALGAVDAFSPADADLSGITGQPGLFVTTVKHGAFIDVNERRTEAAAATVVGVAPGENGLGPRRVIADRPFLFLIYDRPTRALLFMGRVMDPTA